MGALRGADAYVYDRTIDPTDNRRSYVLEHDLQVLLHRPSRVLICNLPGAMISDQLMVSHALFSKKYHPKLVAVTFSPRDFIDNGCPSATSTEAFTFYSKYVDLGPDLNLFFADQKTVLQSILARLSFYRNLIRNKLHLDCSGYSLGSFSSSQLVKSIDSPFKRICPGEVLIGSGDWYYRIDNATEFKRRYRNPFNYRLFVQLKCLDALFSYLRQTNIKVVAFSVPLVDTNKRLLEENFWQFYLLQIKKICQKYDVDWFDLTSYANIFTKDDFVDSVHLNLRGGLKVSRPIAFRIADKLHERKFSNLLFDERDMF